MKSYKDKVLCGFAEITELVGAEFVRNLVPDDEYVQIEKNGMAMRIRWVIERDPWILVTLFIVRAGNRRPRETALSWLVKFKRGSEEDFMRAESDRVDLLKDIIKRYALGYLLGTERDFCEVEEFALRTIVERRAAKPSVKPVKWIRHEWIP